jgi:FkbM family methyltransferase
MGKIIYNIIMFLWKMNPFKHASAKVLRALGLGHDKLYKDLKFKGWLSFFYGGREIFVYSYESVPENEIFWRGFAKTWDKESLELWGNLAKDSKVIFDIGANTGIYSLIAYASNSNSQIFAFEPSKNTFGKLTKNVKINDFSIQCFDCALSNSKGKFIFYDPDYGHQTNASLSRDMIKDNAILSKQIKLKEYEVQTITCDEFITEHSLNWPDLVKIDVEMHEPEVLSGMRKTLEFGRPVILIEILTHKVGEGVFEVMKDYKYCYFSLSEDKGPELRTKIEPDYCFNYLLVPEEKIELLKAKKA